MEEWHDRWFQQLWKDITDVADEFARDFTELTEEIATEAQEILNFQWEELKQVLTQLWQDFELEFEQIEQINWDTPTHFTFNDRMMPDPATHPACVGCINYHGTAFGGNLLVCGMHPYGSEHNTCNDWEGENDQN
jgi:hypothetical protein